MKSEGLTSGANRRSRPSARAKFTVPFPAFRSALSRLAAAPRAH